MTDFIFEKNTIFLTIFASSNPICDTSLHASRAKCYLTCFEFFISVFLTSLFAFFNDFNILFPTINPIFYWFSCIIFHFIFSLLLNVSHSLLSFSCFLFLGLSCKSTFFIKGSLLLNVLLS